MRLSGIILFFLIAPLVAFSAGFAKDSLFISHKEVSEGDRVRIYAVISNDTNLSSAAKVVFKDGEKTIGEVPVSLAAGEATTVSIYWEPKAGSHRVVAEFTSEAGTVIETQSVSLTVAKKAEDEQASSDSPAEVESSAGLQNTISTYSPATADVLGSTFSFIDSSRTKAAGALDNQIAWTKEKVDASPPSLGKDVGSWLDTLWFVLYTLYLYVLTVLRFVIAHVGAFYPAVALIFFFILWRIFRRIRRPAV